jgi:NAD(P)H dehydrogenase (quinone)
VAAAPRADYAAAAAAVLTGEGHENTVYELAGDTAWSFADLARVISEVSGTPVTYRDLPADDYAALLTEAGVPAEFARFSATLETDVAAGTLADAPGTLSRLIGRPTVPLRDSVAALLKG